MSQSMAPKLSREEELYVLSLTDLVGRAVGEDAAKLVAGEQGMRVIPSPDKSAEPSGGSASCRGGHGAKFSLFCAGDAVLEPAVVARFVLSVLATGDAILCLHPPAGVPNLPRLMTHAPGPKSSRMGGGRSCPRSRQPRGDQRGSQLAGPARLHALCGCRGKHQEHHGAAHAVASRLPARGRRTCRLRVQDSTCSLRLCAFPSSLHAQSSMLRCACAGRHPVAEGRRQGRAAGGCPGRGNT